MIIMNNLILKNCLKTTFVSNQLMKGPGVSEFHKSSVTFMIPWRKRVEFSPTMDAVGMKTLLIQKRNAWDFVRMKFYVKGVIHFHKHSVLI